MAPIFAQIKGNFLWNGLTLRGFLALLLWPVLFSFCKWWWITMGNAVKFMPALNQVREIKKRQ